MGKDNRKTRQKHLSFGIWCCLYYMFDGHAHCVSMRNLSSGPWCNGLVFDHRYKSIIVSLTFCEGFEQEIYHISQHSKCRLQVGYQFEKAKAQNGDWLTNKALEMTWCLLSTWGYWCPGAKAPDHQYPWCWPNNHCIRLNPCRKSEN